MPHVDHLVRKFYFRTYTSEAIKMEVLKLKFLFVILVFNFRSLLYISYRHWEIPFLSSLILIIYLSRKKEEEEFVERKRVQIKYTGGYIEGHSNSENVNLTNPGSKKKKKKKIIRKCASTGPKNQSSNQKVISET
jgi:hypothetical protein